jgi:hypothetical protein
MRAQAALSAPDGRSFVLLPELDTGLCRVLNGVWFFEGGWRGGP